MEEVENGTVAEQQVAPVNEAPAEGTGEVDSQDSKNELPEWTRKRFGELTAQRYEAERKANEAEQRAQVLQKQLESYSNSSDQQANPQVPTQNVEQLARIYAEDLANQKIQAESFQRQVQTIEEAGKKQFSDGFDKAVDNLRLAGVGSSDFLQVLANVPSAEKVVYYLGQADNVGEAIRLSSLPPLQMGIEIMKLAPIAAKALSKSVSNAPAPITPIDGSGSVQGVPDPKNTAEWMAWRIKTKRKR